MPETSQNAQPSKSDADETVNQLPEEHPIKLSSRTLVHISSGLYRSTANALKELVSNSFDADAKTIRINTNFPEFDVLTCSDDGEGMDKAEFERLMNGGIGNSRKRIGEGNEPLRTSSGRPIIGRIGIGMLAIAQVCYEFKIVSHHAESKTAFAAVLNLNPRRLSEASSEESAPTDEEASTEGNEPTEEQNEEYQIGYYTCVDIPYNSKQAGFFISTDDLLTTYTARYREDVQRKEFRKIPKNFKEFLIEVAKEKYKSVTSLGDYWRLFWELSVASPVAYMKDGPFSETLIKSAVKHDSREDVKQVAKVIEELRDELEGYNFKVILDGVPLHKPVLIPNIDEKAKTKEKPIEESQTRLTPVNYNKTIIGLPLKFRGYIYTQTQAIYPRELRGILIRVKNVAIGDYDWSCLNYEDIQGFRLEWLSGEIYVDEGLEEALNVDRHSFNEVHPHYLELQKRLHYFLKVGKVFSEARKASEAKHKLKEQVRARDTDNEFIKAVHRVLKVKYQIHRDGEHILDGKPLEINTRKHTIVLYDKHPLWPRRRSERLIAEKVLIAFKLAQTHEKSSERIDEKFLAILQEVL